ncbi:hypothetical protein BGW80DRAFT_1434568 [Lactifluus volemus]|nr:hypothetical protein BGW80DRAFT_1434568 [Lactifluus volemus]
MCKLARWLLMVVHDRQGVATAEVRNPFRRNDGTLVRWSVSGTDISSVIYSCQVSPCQIEIIRDTLHTKKSLHIYIQLDFNRSTRPGSTSTAALLVPLLKDFPDRCHISLFRSPKLKGGFGTWHAKIYGADDSIMISGANLNKSYFTDRQDRYLLFSSAPELSSYCFDFLKTASSFSYELLPSQYQATRILEDSVVIFPVIQAGQFNIREEEECLRQLFYHLEAVDSRRATQNFHPLLSLTTGYFGLFKSYKDLILRSHVPTHIICASPRANGFYGSKGISSRLPEAYTRLEQQFMAALKEWNRHGWTYHAKGIWLSPTAESLPVLTLFGSTNLNSRSAHLDTELSFMMLANSVTVQKKLQLELQQLNEFAEDWKGDQRRVRLVTKI